MIEAAPALAADSKPEMPVPPNLDMSKLSIANLALLVEFFDGLSHAALGFINMPKFKDTAAEDYLDPYWGHYINGMWGRVIDEIEARVGCGRCFWDGYSFNGIAGRFLIDRDPTLPNPKKQPEQVMWEVNTNVLSWDAENPRFLLLGVSKGPNQNQKVCDMSRHDEVAFAGLRNTITQQLRCLNLFPSEETLDEKITADEEDWAFASVVPCALGTVNEEGVATQTKNVVGPLADMNFRDSWIRKCVSIFYPKLPSRLKVVVLLSNDEAYVSACCRAFSAVDPSIAMLSGIDVAYGNDEVTFVHIVHPASLRGSIDSPGPGNHVANWKAGGNDKQGRKMQMVKSVLKERAAGRLKT